MALRHARRSAKSPAGRSCASSIEVAAVLESTADGPRGFGTGRLELQPAQQVMADILNHMVEHTETGDNTA